MGKEKINPNVPQVVHEKGEFQLSRDLWGMKFGFPIDGIVDNLFKWLNNLNLNKNTKSDVAETAPFVIAATPIILAMFPKLRVFLANLSPEGVVTWLLSHKEFYKDAAAAATHVKDLTPHLEELAHVAQNAETVLTIAN